MVVDRQGGRGADQGSRSPGSALVARARRARSHEPSAEAARRSASATASPSPTAASSRRRSAPDLPRELVLDHADLAAPRRESSRASSATGSTRTRRLPLGDDGTRPSSSSVLAHSFELRSPLVFELADEERQLYRLTEEQYRVLDMLSRQPRVCDRRLRGLGQDVPRGREGPTSRGAGVPRPGRRLQRPARRSPAPRARPT